MDGLVSKEKVPDIKYDGVCLQVLGQLKEHSILLYNVGEAEDQPPYAVVSSNTLTRLGDGRRVRGREYPWGTVNIEDKVGGVPIDCEIFANLGLKL